MSTLPAAAPDLSGGPAHERASGPSRPKPPIPYHPLAPGLLHDRAVQARCLLQNRGWNPAGLDLGPHSGRQPYGPLGLLDAVLLAATGRLVRPEPNSPQRRIWQALLTAVETEQALTVAGAGSPDDLEVWETEPGRQLEDVLGLLSRVETHLANRAALTPTPSVRRTSGLTDGEVRLLQAVAASRPRPGWAPHLGSLLRSLLTGHRP